MVADCVSVKCVADVVYTLMGALAILGGGVWFLYTTQFKPRVQFDLDCRVFPLNAADDSYLVEVWFIFENQGFVEHRLYDLSLSIHGLQPGSSTTGRKFLRTLSPREVVVPRRYNWYFVRPGVHQVVRHYVVLEAPGPLLELTAGFNYRRESDWPHTARRVFSLGSVLEPVSSERNQGTELAC